MRLNTDLSEKQDKITGASTTITSSNLTSGRALVSNSSGKVGASAVTSTELGYLSGVTSKIQTQINNITKVTKGTINATYGCYYVSYGKTVNVVLDYRQNVTSNIIVGQLPATCLPIYTIYEISFNGNSYVSIDTSGNIVMSPISTGGWCICCLVFIAK